MGVLDRGICLSQLLYPPRLSKGQTSQNPNCVTPNHHQHVTQPLLGEQGHQLGIDISAGELNRILTEGKDAFHREKDEMLSAAVAVSTYVEVDDTGRGTGGTMGPAPRSATTCSPPSPAPTARAGST